MQNEKTMEIRSYMSCQYVKLHSHTVKYFSRYNMQDLASQLIIVDTLLAMEHVPRFHSI